MVGFFTNRWQKQARAAEYLRYGRVCLKPLSELEQTDWKRVQSHFRDSEISYLNGTPPNRMPLWFLKRLLKADSRRSDRATYGIFDERDEYIGTIELYDIRYDVATLGIIIGEKTHWSKGYGPEAIEALLHHAFNRLNLERVKLNTFSDNERAQAAFKKIGFSELRRVNAGNGRIDVQMDVQKRVWLERQAIRRG